MVTGCWGIQMAVVQPVFAAGMAALAATGANAQTIDQAPIDDGIFGPFELSSNIALVSDYRGRGVSYTDNSIAIQGGVDIVEPSGWSAGVWASTIGDATNADFEIDLYAARSFAVGPVEMSFGAAAYVFPEGDDWDFVDVQANIAVAIGPIDTTLSVNYAWEQENLGDEDDIYVALNGTTPIGTLGGVPLSLGGSVGFEEGAFAIEDAKLDWSLSVTAEIEEIAFSVSYIDTDLHGDLGEPGLVFSIARTF